LLIKSPERGAGATDFSAGAVKTVGRSAGVPPGVPPASEVWTLRVGVPGHRYGTGESGSTEGAHHTSPAQRAG